MEEKTVPENIQPTACLVGVPYAVYADSALQLCCLFVRAPSLEGARTNKLCTPGCAKDERLAVVYSQAYESSC